MELPITSLTEKFKCALIRLEKMTSESRDVAVRNIAPTVSAGSGTPWEAVL